MGFNLASALESADNDLNGDGADYSPETAGGTVSDAIIETEQLAQESADAETEAEMIDKGQEDAEAIVEEAEAAAEANDGYLDPTAARILRKAMSRIVGENVLKKNKIPAQESWGSSRSVARESTTTALEGLKDTLKSFWEAIKSAFNKAFAAVKSWIISTFSGAKKLAEKAKKLQDKADSTTGSIEDKTFSFAQTKSIAVDGKYNDAGALVKGLAKVEELVDSNIEYFKKSKVDDMSEALINAVEKSFVKVSGSKPERQVSSDKTNELVKVFIEAAKVSSASAVPSSVGDVRKYSEQFGDLNEVSVKATTGLPGGKAIVVVIPNGTSSKTGLEFATRVIKAGKTMLASDRYTPRDITEGDVKTLTATQCSDVASDVIKIAENIFGYEKNWKNRETLINKLVKETDQMVKDFENEDDVDAKDEREFRAYISAQVGVIRREGTFQASICQYGLTTGAAFLNYAERSLAKHK